MASDFQLNLGSLRSAMKLTLHTHQASRLWHGRASAEGIPGIIGLSGFLSITNKMMRGVAQDDPYSDFWMLRVEQKSDEVKSHLSLLKEQIAQVFAQVPSALSLGQNLNLQPATLSVFANSPLGFLAIYLIADYDELARQAILAHHTALVDRATLDHWLESGGHQLRSLFTLVQRYRYSGTKRDDFAANNAVARAALEKYGPLPQDILEGTRRSRYAPPIIQPPRLRTPSSGTNARLREPLEQPSGAEVPDEPASAKGVLA